MKRNRTRLAAHPWLPDLPYHPCNQGDVQPLTPGQTVELVIDLFPVSHSFQRGHSVRVSGRTHHI